MTEAEQTTVALEFEALDVLFFRDGRPFEPATRATTGVPAPQTLAGAVRTWLLGRAGVDFRRLAADISAGATFLDAAIAQEAGAVARLRFQGPWFVLDGKRTVPTPANLEIDRDGAIVRLDPLSSPLPGWTEDGLRPIWRRGRGATKRRGGHLLPSGLSKYLAGGVPDPAEIVDDDALFGTEDRVGIGVDADRRSAREGLIYAISMLRLCPNVRIAVEVTGPISDVAKLPEKDLLALGGEARRAIVRRAVATTWPGLHGTTPRGRLALLTTPAPFGGWCPSGLSPCAAAVPGHLAVSGWDLARGGPKPNRFAVPAGSVYFFDDPKDLSGRQGSLCTGEDAALGWGAFIEGGWDDA